MYYIVTNHQMREAEQGAVALGISLQTLMENAGKACFEKINELCKGVGGKSFVVLCGRGNNGGDGIVLAHHLKENNADVLCVFVGGLPESECAKESYRRYGDEFSIILYHQNEDKVKKALLNCEVIIDCVFGTGFHGTLERKELFNFINTKCHSLKIAVDIPAGVNSDTGEMAECTFLPDITLTLGAVKQGLLRQPCANHLGQLILLDIGIPEEAFVEYEATFMGEIFKDRDKPV
jgi:NAD(P)H-hydrate epimerase